jgi:hypothetical protein
VQIKSQINSEGRFAAQRGQAPSPQRAEQIKSSRGGLIADLASGCTRDSVGASLLAKGISLLASKLRMSQNPVGAAVRRFDLPAMADCQALFGLRVYISIPWVMATMVPLLQRVTLKSPK